MQKVPQKNKRLLLLHIAGDNDATSMRTLDKINIYNWYIVQPYFFISKRKNPKFQNKIIGRQ